MNDDAFFRSVFGIAEPVPSPVFPRKLDQHRFYVQPDYSGAVFRGTTLFVATLAIEEFAPPKLVKKRCGKVELSGRSQAAVRCFSSDICELLHNLDITHLTFRYTHTGQFTKGTMGGVLAKTVLQLTSGVYLDVINTVSVTRWMNRCEPTLPEWDHPKAAVAMSQRRAIEAAAFAAAHDGDPHYSGDNEDE